MSSKSRPKLISIELFSDNVPSSGPKVREAYTLRQTLYKTRIGINLPMYKSIISRGENATTLLVASKMTLARKSGLCVYSNNRPADPNYGIRGQSSHCGLPLFTAPTSISSDLVSNAQNRAAIAIRQKIHDQSTQFSGFTVLGELRETINMIRHPAEAAFKLSDSFLRNELLRKKTFMRDLNRSKHGKTPSSAKRKVLKKQYADAVAGSWLEFSFGLKPLIHDITDIAESTFARLQEDTIKRLTARGVSQSAKSSVYSSGVPATFITANFCREDIRTAKSRYLIGYRVKTEFNSHAFQNVIARGGFNLTELVPTAWELLPWSFFIDYFSNIGDLLNTHLVSLENVAWAGRTDHYENLIRCHSGSATALYNSYYQKLEGFSSPRLEATYSTVNRSAAEIPFGTLRFELPGKRDQFFNIGALATLQFTKFL